MLQLPALFIKRMERRFGKEELALFFNSYENEPAPTIRLNSRKSVSLFDELKSVPWFQNGRYLNEKKRFITDPLWHAGAYYVQEASSMFLGEIYRQLFPDGGPKRALDLSAAPGGKSTLLQSLLPDDSVLIANEVIKTRAQILKENHIRLGISSNVIITQNDPKDFSELTYFFDYIQVDAPCSGEGMFRKGDVALNEWSEANCNLCAQRQRRILADIIPSLSKDGILIYSTCTFNKNENEDNVDWMKDEFDMDVLEIQHSNDWGITPAAKGMGYYFYPHKVKGEGLFIAVLRKRNGGDLPVLKNITNKGKVKLLESLVPHENIVMNKEDYYFETSELRSVKSTLDKYLNIIYSGVELGALKGKDFMPAQAMTNFHLPLHHFPTYEVDYEIALEFLRGNDPKLTLPEKGIYLLTYNHLGLGWIKNIGNRSNNYYPKPWRIKKY